jgi:predicted transcriptional regulator
MKTAISLPDDLFRSIDARARVLKMSRSSLLARAAREFLERATHTGPSATEAWNRAIEKGGQPGDEPAALAFKSRTKAMVRGQRGRGR